MAPSTQRTRIGAGIALSTIFALALAGCASGGGGGTDGEGSDAASATSVDDFGSFEELEAAAKSEGQLNVITLPRDWANYGAVLDAFAAKYPEITINEANPEGSSSDAIAAAKTNEGLDTAPDVFDLGLTVALANTSLFAPYEVQTWDDIPDELKESSGTYVGGYGGYMSVGYDSSKLPEPKTIADLAKPEYKGSVAINGDPTQAGAAFAAVGLATVLNGGTLDDFQPGIDFYSDLNSAGNFIKVDPTTATVESGETPLVFDWDYLNLYHAATNDDWKVVVFDTTGYAGYYYQAINKGAPNPAAARLWQEFLYSDEGQNLWLQGGARPVRVDAMTEAGTVDADAMAKLPKAPKETVYITEEQSAAAGKLLGEKWASAIQ